MRNHNIGSALVLLGFLAAACDHVSPNAPTTKIESMTTSSTASISLSVTPATLASQPVPNSLCPSVPPFAVPFQLVVRGGTVDTSINDITMQFRDTLGAQMPPVTLPGPLVTAQFGSPLIPAATVRNLPLTFTFGCGTSLPGTLTVTLNSRDANGRIGSAQITAPVH